MDTKRFENPDAPAERAIRIESDFKNLYLMPCSGTPDQWREITKPRGLALMEIPPAVCFLPRYEVTDQLDGLFTVDITGLRLTTKASNLIACEDSIFATKAPVCVITMWGFSGARRVADATSIYVDACKALIYGYQGIHGLQSRMGCMPLAAEIVLHVFDDLAAEHDGQKMGHGLMAALVAKMLTDELSKPVHLVLSTCNGDSNEIMFSKFATRLSAYWQLRTAPFWTHPFNPYLNSNVFSSRAVVVRDVDKRWSKEVANISLLEEALKGRICLRCCLSVGGDAAPALEALACPERDFKFDFVVGAHAYALAVKK